MRMHLQKEVKSKPSHEKSVQSEEGHCEISCEIQGGGQEMTMMVG